MRSSVPSARMKVGRAEYHRANVGLLWQCATVITTKKASTWTINATHVRAPIGAAMVIVGHLSTIVKVFE